MGSSEARLGNLSLALVDESKRHADEEHQVERDSNWGVTGTTWVLLQSSHQSMITK